MSEMVKATAKKPETKRENKAKTQKKWHSQSINSPVEQILFLQRTVGNQAVLRLIESGALQTQLRIGAPGDVYEQEADRVAEQVMRMPDPQVSEVVNSDRTIGNTVQRQCPRGTKKQGKEEEEIHAKETAGQTPEVTQEMDNSISSIRGGGQPLPESVRSFFEPRFGHDFSGVRVHTDGKSAESARAVNARAFTVARDIVFGTGEYETGTSDGRKLLAHELTHVVQQRTQTDSVAPAQILQRAVKYIEQVTGDEAEPYLQAFDRTVETIDRQISNTKEQVADDLKGGLAQLRSLRTRNKITCWRVSDGITYASFDNATGEIRLHINIGSAASSPVSLIHEAIHALHASRYARLSRMYADVLAAGGTTNESIGVLLLKWKAWTEYWAYRRHVELGNLSQPPESRRDPDITARKEPAVVASIAKVMEFTEVNFDPANWTPPAQYRTKSGKK